MKKQKTTNALRMITAAKLPHEAIEYDAGEVGDNFGEKIAEEIGLLSKEQFFKTLVAKGDKNGIMVACIPCNHEVDLKKLAKVSGNKKAEMIHVKDLLALTGYVRGSVSPIGMKKKYPTYLSDTALDKSEIIISGGVCGLAVKMSPENIQKMTDCKFEDIITKGE